VTIWEIIIGVLVIWAFCLIIFFFRSKGEQELEKKNDDSLYDDLKK